VLALTKCGVRTHLATKKGPLYEGFRRQPTSTLPGAIFRNSDYRDHPDRITKKRGARTSRNKNRTLARGRSALCKVDAITDITTSKYPYLPFIGESPMNKVIGLGVLSIALFVVADPYVDGYLLVRGRGSRFLPSLGLFPRLLYMDF
jgi:hypothetical protein